MAVQYTAKIPYERVIKIGMYNNQSTRYNLTKVYNLLCSQYPGKEVYITNGGFFNMGYNWSACWGLKANNQTISDGWPGSCFMAMNGKTIKYYPTGNNFPANFTDGITGYPALIDNGKKSPEFHNGPDGKSDRGRTMIGYNDKYVILSCIGDIAGATDYTLTEELNYMLSQGCTYAVNLDGGGSSQCNFNGKKINSSRLVHNMVYIIAEPDNSPDPKKLFQQWLNDNYNAKLVVDGLLGPATRKATIKAIQKEIGVTADGLWGPISKSRFKYLGLGSPNNTKNLVILLQGALMRKNYWSEVCDGNFDKYLENQVVLYQRANKLETDGKAGPATITSLLK